jgi:hypothetical protein
MEEGKPKIVASSLLVYGCKYSCSSKFCDVILSWVQVEKFRLEVLIIAMYSIPISSDSLPRTVFVLSFAFFSKLNLLFNDIVWVTNTLRACSVDRGLTPKRNQYREGLSGSLPCHLIPVGNLPPNPSLYAMCSVSQGLTQGLAHLTLHTTSLHPYFQTSVIT